MCRRSSSRRQRSGHGAHRRGSCPRWLRVPRRPGARRRRRLTPCSGAAWQATAHRTAGYCVGHGRWHRCQHHFGPNTLHVPRGAQLRCTQTCTSSWSIQRARHRALHARTPTRRHAAQGDPCRLRPPRHAGSRDERSMSRGSVHLAIQRGRTHLLTVCMPCPYTGCGPAYTGCGPAPRLRLHQVCKLPSTEAEINF